ncbi:hypothetical protein DV735_g1534, partial [Chaetothyriales sp. CBS 134920]
MPDRVSTSRHDPAYVSPARINYIVSSLYPNYSANVTDPPRGFSIGSPIYSLEIAPNPSPPSFSGTVKAFHAMLKVCGRAFNHTKIQNEVAALFLLARYCPSVPVPQVIAWSEDGVTISTFHQPIPDSSGLADEKPRPWILVSQPPGRPLKTADLDSVAGPAILAQVAQHNAAWRRYIPSLPVFGNVRFRSSSSPPNALPPHETLNIDGFLLCHRPVPGPVTTTLDYYMAMLKDQIHKVMSSRPYDDVRCDLVPLVAEFIERDLLYLSCVRPSNREEISPIFSNLELSPRNILVDYGPSGQVTVTGIVNFEFAAFLPEIDEFANEFIRREGDWQERHYTILMDELGRLGVRVPPLPGLSREVDNKFSDQEWAEACLLWKLIDNVAPSYIVDGNPDNPKLVNRASIVVRDCIDRLQRMRPHRTAPKLRPGLLVNREMVGPQQPSRTNWDADRTVCRNPITSARVASDPASRRAYHPSRTRRGSRCPCSRWIASVKNGNAVSSVDRTSGANTSFSAYWCIVSTDSVNFG